MTAKFETLACERIECRHRVDRYVAAAAAFAMGARSGLDGLSARAIAIAAAELTSNAVRHGGGGELEIRVIRDGKTQGMELVCTDHGPGIADVERAIEDGVSQGREPVEGFWSMGLGTGLGAVKRAMHELRIDTAPGAGTCIVARWWSRVAH